MDEQESDREWLRMQLIGSLSLDPEIKDKAFDVLMDIWIRDYVKMEKAA